MENILTIELKSNSQALTLSDGDRAYMFWKLNAVASNTIFLTKCILLGCEFWVIPGSKIVEC